MLLLKVINFLFINYFLNLLVPITLIIPRAPVILIIVITLLIIILPLIDLLSGDLLVTPPPLYYRLHLHIHEQLIFLLGDFLLSWHEMHEICH